MENKELTYTVAAFAAVIGGVYAFKSGKLTFTGNEGQSDQSSTKASLISASINRMGTDEQLLFKTLSQISTKDEWAKVQSAYYDQMDSSLMNDLRKDLSTDEYVTLVDYISLNFK